MIFLFVKFSTYSNPQDRSRTDLGSQPHVCSLFSFVFRGDKSRPTADCQSSARGRGQEDYQSLSYLQFYSLTRKNKSQEKSNGGQPRLPPLSLHRFCFREPLRKTLTDFFFGYLSYFLGTQVHTEPAVCLTHTCSALSFPVTSAVYFASLRTV